MHTHEDATHAHAHAGKFYKYVEFISQTRTVTVVFGIVHVRPEDRPAKTRQNNVDWR